jgi:hypothetical protein
LGERGASAARTLARIEALRFTHVLMIPDSESRLLYDAIRSSALSLITPCREGESIAIAAGLCVLAAAVHRSPEPPAGS